MNYAKIDCSTESREFISEVISEAASIVGEGIIGVYLHGSLAMGGFNPTGSDIDLIIVTVQPLPLEMKRELAELFLTYSNRPFPIEINFLNNAYLRDWQHPAPYDFHFSEFWRERYEKELGKGTSIYLNDEIKTDIDLAAHLTILNKRGICLNGKPIHETFPPIPKYDYVSSILADYEECLEKIHADPVYCILNLIRVYWYLKEGEISSKKEAGEWGALNLPLEFQPIVQKAAEAYGNKRSGVFFAATDLIRLRDYLKRNVEELLNHVE